MTLPTQITFLRSHLALLAVILLLVSFAGYLYLDRAAQHAHDQAVIAQHDLDAAKQANADLAKLAAQQQAIIEQQRVALDAQNRALEAERAARDAALRERQKQDSQLPPTELAARMAKLSGASQDQIKAQTDGSLTLAQPASVIVTAKLEEIPVLEASVGDLQTELKNKDQVIVGLDQTVKLKDEQLAQDKVVLAAQIDTDNKKYHELVLKSRKSKIKVFFAGYIAGFLTRTMLH